jgi:TRAP-type C4-dicarboxylate transport system substrate-binding protein
MKITFAKLTVAGIAAATAAAVALPASAAVTLKVSSCLVRNHDQVEAYFKTFHEPINAMSAKTGLTLNYIGGPEVTPWQKQAPALQRGLIDIINCPSAYYHTQVPAARVAGVNNVSPTEIRKNGGMEIMQDAWKQGLNAMILGWGHWESSRFFLYTKFEPKEDPKLGVDLTGKKIRSTPLYSDFLKAMNATAVTIAPDDVYAALERGVVDGLAWPEGAVAVYGWERFLKFKVTPAFFNSTTMTIMNLDKFKSLSKEHQDLLVKQGLIYEDKSNDVIAAKSKIDNEKLEKAGVKEYQLKGDIAKAYLNTVYGGKWAANDKAKYKIDYQALKSKVFDPSK